MTAHRHAGPAGVDLTGIVLPDAGGGDALDLGAEPGPTLLILIRHRY